MVGSFLVGEELVRFVVLIEIVNLVCPTVEDFLGFLRRLTIEAQPVLLKGSEGGDELAKLADCLHILRAHICDALNDFGHREQIVDHQLILILGDRYGFIITRVSERGILIAVAALGNINLEVETDHIHRYLGHIDEPEIHLHRSIMNRLWSALESYRPDCLFIYITHDTQFAAAHGQSDKVWIKEFDGTHWKLEIIDDQELPEELLFDILGSRKNVLFVEGERNSYDTQLYSILYPSYYVIACGSCTQVISRTKAFRNSPSLHHCQVFGIIDRDYRSDYEIEKYKNDGIYALKVAEVENLFLVEELIRLIADHLGQSPDESFAPIREYVIHTRFAHQIDRQICQSVVAHLKYQLTAIELSKKNDDEAKNSLNTALQNIDYEKTKAEEESKFRGALREDDYAKVLSVFNEKGLTSSIGHFLGLVDKEYCKSILALLNGKMRNEISDAISTYLPPEIPR